MKNQTLQIAIDGPSGAGKSTMARMLAKELSFLYVDTGAMYRSIGLYASRRGIELSEIQKILPLLNEISIQLEWIGGAQHIFLCGEDVSEEIRTEKISRYASAVSALPEVRRFLLDLQRQLASRHNVIMDGRDIGTVILPDAQVKIFLTASPEKRAMRRYEELKAKGQTVTYEAVYQDLLQRDQQDSSRQAAPLKAAEDAVLLSSTEYTLEETLTKMKEIITEKCGHVI
ncbi:(d)CMP kinase [Acidaminobacterium chupaoyuni]